MYEKVILGFLRLRPLTAYDVAQAMQRSTRFFYNVSQGSIHPALGRLVKAGHATVSPRVEGGRHKKVYTITDAGHAAFDTWLSAPLAVGKVKDEVVLRLFFLGALDSGRRRALLEAYLDELAAERTTLLAAQAEGQAKAAAVPDALRDVATYQLHTVQFGLDYYAFVENWVRTLLQSEPGGSLP